MDIKEISYGYIEKDDEPTLGTKKKKSWKKIPLYIDYYEVYKMNISSSWDAEFILKVWDPKNKQVVMELTLMPRRWENINAYAVYSAYVALKYQGQGVGFALYKGLIELYDLSLLSVGEHSIGARKLWMYLGQDPKIRAYGFHPEKQKAWKVAPDNKKKQLKTIGKNPPVYGNDNGHGIILVKKNGVHDKKLQEFLKRKKNKPKGDVLGTTQFYDIGYD